MTLCSEISCRSHFLPEKKPFRFWSIFIATGVRRWVSCDRIMRSLRSPPSRMSMRSSSWKIFSKRLNRLSNRNHHQSMKAAVSNFCRWYFFGCLLWDEKLLIFLQNIFRLRLLAYGGQLCLSGHSVPSHRPPLEDNLTWIWQLVEMPHNECP